MRRTKILIWVWGLLVLPCCAGIGPTIASRDRFDYTATISDSWKHQMLFNLLKIRYGDAPVFLDVSSVISQYQIAGQISLGATFNHNPWSSSEVLVLCPRESCHLDPFECLRVNSGRDLLATFKRQISHFVRNDI